VIRLASVLTVIALSFFVLATTRERPGGAVDSVVRAAHADDVEPESVAMTSIGPAGEVDARPETRRTPVRIEDVVSQARVDIRVLDEFGRPIPGAIVSAIGPAMPRFLGQNQIGRICRTDDDGLAPYEVRPLSTLMVRAFTPAGFIIGADDVHTPPAGETVDRVLRFEPAAPKNVVRVIVRSAVLQRPIEATVATRIVTSGGGLPEDSVGTDRDGLAVLAYDTGEQVVVTAAGFHSVTLSIPPGGGPQLLHVDLEPRLPGDDPATQAVISPSRPSALDDVRRRDTIKRVEELREKHRRAVREVLRKAALERQRKQ
jgi:hypothetical protein